ncbi:Sex comb on midleg-like protein 2 [Intoshia linei]|uniref:Sex comb on midleg-like protein 2 n=1 Tax=Intoshia linei TaxID=1819745 RepID=A0A177B8M6_9BILA|nr:Sex comb on midleg-like protein 2 [Intoshia linei]
MSSKGKQAKDNKNSHQSMNNESSDECGNKSNPPYEYFMQNYEIPENRFKEGMRVETCDPRIPNQICVATIVGMTGPRIRLRLDGTDGTNDFWHMVDSSNIQPMGTAKAQQKMVQPPLGFQMNRPTSWTTFYEKILSDTTSFAPADCFIPEPSHPPMNQFEINNSIEAVDRKNPQLICPATITDVKNDEIFVTFDGWKGVLDYWTDYDSRDIFPSGWCKSANHPIQSPGDKNSKSTKVSNYYYIGNNGKLMPSNSNRQSENENSKVVGTYSFTAGNNGKSVVKAVRKSRHSKETYNSVSQNHINSSLDDTVLPTMATKKRFRNEKLGRRKQQKEMVKSSLKRNKENIIHLKNKSDCLNLICNEDIPLTEYVKHEKDKEMFTILPKIEHTSMIVYTNAFHKEVKFGKFIDVDKAKKVLPKWFGPCSVGRLLKDILYSCVKMALNPLEMFNSIIDGTGYLNFHVSIDKIVYHKNLPNVMNMSQLMSYIDDLGAILGYKCLFTENKLTDDANSTENEEIKSKSNNVSRIDLVENATSDSDSDSRVLRKRINREGYYDVSKKHKSESEPEDDVVHMEKENNINIELKTPIVEYDKWSTDDVMNYLTSHYPSLENIRDFVISHEIDGPALVLLSCEDMIKYLNIKLGPALKIERCIKKMFK